MLYASDNFAVLRDVWSGQIDQRFASTSFHANLWRKVSSEIKTRCMDATVATESFHKVKAHQTRTQALEGGEAMRHWV